MKFNIVGLMSGTSVDAIDVSVFSVRVDKHKPIKDNNADQFTYKIKERAFQKVPWSESTRLLIFKLFDPEKSNVVDLCEANFILGKEFANAVNKVLIDNQINSNEIDLIGSHGQTIWHNIVRENNDEKVKVTSTLQIGCISVIANITGITTVGDFRVADVINGGQGAPFASIFDYLMCRNIIGDGGHDGDGIGIQNIGGIGNITILPNNTSKYEPLSFDNGPGNVLIDWISTKISNGLLTYDKDGEMGQKGRVNQQLLDMMIKETPYLGFSPPKSTGRELFSFQYAQQWYDIGKQQCGIQDDTDFVSTFTELTAVAIANSIREFTCIKVKHLYIGGGGSLNPYLMSRIQSNVGEHTLVHKHNQLGIDSESKEAIIFGLLGLLNTLNLGVDLSPFTGSKKPSSSNNNINYTPLVVLGKSSPGKNHLELIKKMYQFISFYWPVHQDKQYHQQLGRTE
ncbi:hypothetical protein CYY_008669 [Polysphondylium violaceum]|uniref:Anhydro-N-acetylmuramic acid kinase n=1 Tax=Polysphondylium violaceum TaxID=133409 RepID=A0A8J4PN47_9MYCE|nr:hypothetical protein CYY_008669 [Polysphondylium violaceum]